MLARVLVVDDELLARKRISQMLNKDRDVEIVGEARNGAEAIEAIITLAPDIVFLDVQMPDMSGFDLLARLNGNLPLIIFVTAFDQYALRAFDVHALDYLLKPIDRTRFARAVHHAKEQMKRPLDGADPQGIRALMEELRTSERYLERFAVKADERVLFIRAEDVDSIEAQGNYVRLNVGTSSYMIRERINGLESQLNPRRFVRVHRSTIVNVDRVKELHSWARGEQRVVLHNKTYFTLSRGYREHFDHCMKNR